MNGAAHARTLLEGLPAARHLSSTPASISMMLQSELRIVPPIINTEIQIAVANWT